MKTLLSILSMLLILSVGHAFAEEKTVFLDKELEYNPDPNPAEPPPEARQDRYRGADAQSGPRLSDEERQAQESERVRGAGQMSGGTQRAINRMQGK